MSEVKNLYQRLLAISDEIATVAKNLDVSVGKGGSYKAVGEVDVIRAVKPIEVKHGVYSYPSDRKITETSVLTTVKEYNGNKTESNQLFMRIETTYRFVNVDKPEEFIEVKTYGDGLDSGDKAPGKAMTYADKYALLKAYKIATGDDPDQEGSHDLKQEAKATQKQVEILSRSYTGENLKKLLESNNITKLEEISMKKASEIIGILMAKKEQK